MLLLVEEEETTNLFLIGINFFLDSLLLIEKCVLIRGWGIVRKEEKKYNAEKTQSSIDRINKLFIVVVVDRLENT